MFTGLVSDVGTIIAAEGDSATLRKFRIETSYDPASIELGASIACAGVCLTAVDRGAEGNMRWFEVHAAAETLSRTLARDWSVGARVNLERSLRVGDELGGHLVTGHVDGVADIVRREDITDGSGPWGATAKFIIRPPRDLMRFIAEKGSVSLDGTSLTVNEAQGDWFSVLLIPHTLAVTTWGDRRTGDRVHVEIDMLARYAARLMEAKANGF
ncbi:MAG: riboflavin synthase subunit alpha [Rhizobiales bacterium 65-9]|nr:riboflavin synthase [Hyphomicrobiales bacterium]OJY36783.1 MAG: riboflavin synthase subunit alpha [Rhizobiales bacterium 65-9]